MDYDEACDEIKLDNMDYEDMFRKFWTMASRVMDHCMLLQVCLQRTLHDVFFHRRNMDHGADKWAFYSMR